jgi:hypothetical protein
VPEQSSRRSWSRTSANLRLVRCATRAGLTFRWGEAIGVGRREEK